MYKVHTKYSLGWSWYMLVKVFQFTVQTSMYSLSRDCISTYNNIVQDLLETTFHCTYYLVQPVTIQGTSELEVRTRLHLSSLCLRLCKLHPASNSCVPLNRDRLYKVICTVKRRFKEVLYDSMVCTKYVQVCTVFIPSMCKYILCS
jgi:hypothetical protein